MELLLPQSRFHVASAAQGRVHHKGTKTERKLLPRLLTPLCLRVLVVGVSEAVLSAVVSIGAMATSARMPPELLD